ncbi:DNA-binding PadR family transcriptional regulator [Roseivirga ehrenbergii]|jgi:DNA-binding PadR family transcriptional regulator|uniref:PadR family transcriptional regulator n=2 Tax=Roseivirga TaxID=290180 RepID=A0A0L8AGC1_9BACT|nr:MULTISPECIES: PadR family transcriptional regulator [Roseivirga]KOF01433.1 PadR family transcriptional regulator [Roseivirga seohaensis subsp. aquiponti]KYG72054.1 PadR family transcriptional regulator [Roseivirga ehrenbergii]TCL13277.1 DNA-binding PadR family transcriptional regulator [Roseivirga ehrenbergii]|tara:strand:+ start:53794 stop:54132 length:339 start_codon:yes stop_codon:yes gene_type:complete
MSSSKLLKGSLATIVLKLLEENEKMYGYEITQRVKEITAGEFKITEGALYPTLHKLEAEGMLSTETQKVDNRIRKYYSLTKEGNAEAQTKVAELEEFLLNLQKLLNPKLGMG